MSDLARDQQQFQTEPTEGTEQPAAPEQPHTPADIPGQVPEASAGVPGMHDPGLTVQQPMAGSEQGYQDAYADPAFQQPHSEFGAVEPPLQAPPPAMEAGQQDMQTAQVTQPGAGEIPPMAATPEQPGQPIVSPDEDWTPPAPPQQSTHEARPSSPADVRARPLPRINIQAFCEDQGTADILQRASQDRRLAKTHMSVQMGGLEAASHYYRNAPTPNLIIIESMHKRDGLLMDLDRLASVCDSGTKVVVIGHANDVLLYRELLQRGVSEYLVAPLNVAQLMESLSKLYTDPGSEPLGNVIAFVGAKGGVGSSTVCHNTAWAISQDVQSDVVIADLDLPFGTAGLDFNQDPVQGIADALLSPDRLDEVLLDRLLSRCSDYLSLFAAPGTLDRPYDLTAGACDVVVDVLRKNVPYITMDVPHVWTEWAQRVLVQSDRIVITALPDLANLRNTKNLVEKLNAARPNDLAPMLVLNQVGTPKRPEISVKEFASAVDLTPSAVIEFDAQMFGTAANNGQMIEEISPRSKTTEQFRELAQSLTDRTVTKDESNSLLAPILSKLSLKRPGKK